MLVLKPYQWFTAWPPSPKGEGMRVRYPCQHSTRFFAPVSRGREQFRQGGTEADEVLKNILSKWGFLRQVDE